MKTEFLSPRLIVLCLAAGLMFPPPALAREPAGQIPARPELLTFDPLEYEPPHPAEFRRELQSGPVAYIVPDRELPLVNLVVYFRSGSYLVPPGKEGLGDLTGYLLARGGTESQPAEDLEERLDFLAAQLHSGIGETHGTVSLNLLSKDLDEGLEILHEVLTAPRFQENKLGLRKQQILQEMQQRNDDPRAIEARERRFLAFGEEFWANRHTTAESLANLSRDDLQKFHRQWVHPKNMIVAVNGDIDPPEIAEKLNTLFSNWPFPGELAPPIPTNTVFASPGRYIVNKDVSQGRVSILLPGIHRDDPDFFPVLVMNDILGGGGFTSRIMNRVRSDEGLAYAAGSSFPGGVYYPSVFTAGFQSKSRTVAAAISIILEEMKNIAAQSVSQPELITSKQSFIESFPRTFSTKSQIANTFAQDELTSRFKRDPDFWRTYRRNIQAVSAEDVQRVAQKFLHPDKLVILAVGQKNDIVEGHPNYPANIDALTDHPLVELPLRDPMTMQPLR